MKHQGSVMNSIRDTVKSMRSDAASFVYKNQHGGMGEDQSDESDDELIMNKEIEASPMTRRTEKQKAAIQKTKPLGCFGTFMSLFKGFVCTAILFLPAAFKTGGWFFMSILLILSALLTIYCAFLLLEVYKAVGVSSYSDIGFKLFGNKGRIAVNISVACSQTLFCCAYVHFIVNNMHFIFHKTLKWNHEQIGTGIVCGILFCLLCFVRKIEVFASTSTFANIMILVTIIFVVIEGANEITDIKHGEFILGDNTPLVAGTWAQAIGFAVYSYEGIGIVLPV